MLEFSALSGFMRIQEMRSGFLHLKKKVENERPKNFFEITAIRDVMIDPETGRVSPFEYDCELDEPRWSVVSFDKIEAGGLTYAQASALMNELNFQGVSGLCTVTDEAASRVRG